MDGPHPKKSRVGDLLNHAYISDLPVELKNKILVKLPIKEVVRTSILCSKWKDSWASIPELVFEENATESMVDKVLLVHHGPILKFKLAMEHACNEAIGQWLLVLSRNGIVDLELEFQGGEKCKIPSRLFSCLALQSVDLSGCIINAPQFFQGFSLLHTLSLSHFDFVGCSIEKLVSCCPLLDRLSLSLFVQQGCLNICSETLRHLFIFGDFHDLSLQTPNLASGTIVLVPGTSDYQNFSAAKDGKESNITRALGCLSNIQYLEIQALFNAKY